MDPETFPDAWDPARYGRFAGERGAAFDDLLRLVEPDPAMRILDVGCGTGALTARAHRVLAASRTLGIDPSPAMLERALAAPPVEGVTFRAGTAEQPPAGPFDLVLSNAALHWVPEQEPLVRRLAGLLAPGGQLAFQVPVNDDHPTHAVAREVAAEAAFRERLGGFVRVSPVLAPERYAELLDASGFGRVRVRVEVYLHRLAGRDALVEWARGAVLTAYARRLDSAAYSAFLVRYRERLFERVPDVRPFPYTFRRLFVWARLPGR